MNQVHFVRVGAKVPAEIAQAVAELADAGDRSVSREIRRALKPHVARSVGTSALVNQEKRP